MELTGVSPEIITDYIRASFAGTDVQVAGDDVFFIYDPERKFEGAMRIPFATLTTSDAYDQASDLNRPGVYRLNIGAGKETARGLVEEGAEHDLKALDVFMPHPVYGGMGWICILNPSEANFKKAKPALAEAHGLTKAKAERRG